MPETEHVRDHSYVAATPVTDGQTLFVYYGKSGPCTFDLEGNQI